MTTIRDALGAARQRIKPASSSAHLDAQALLGAVLGVGRAYLLAHPEHALSAEQEARFETYVARCAAGEPLAYILGRRAFYDREFMVTPAVLVPRPETELLLEEALRYAAAQPCCIAVDVGTGSGALAITLAARCPQAVVYATDISPDALAVARRNAEQHRVAVEFMHGDLLTPLIERGLKADLVMANLPYIASDELAELPARRHEPRLALDGGADGLDAIRGLLAQAAEACAPGALLLVEIGATQGSAALALVKQTLATRQVEVLKDYGGLDRVVRVTLD